jgi:four helix bundle protein
MENGKDQLPRSATKKIADFTDLETWKFARQLRGELYHVVQTFPPDEKFVLSAQIKRAAISVTTNLAEGYGRYSYQENVQFCRQSRGSLYELRDHLTSAVDAGYIPQERYKQLDALAVSAIQLVNGYIRATRNLKTSADVSKKT